MAEARRAAVERRTKETQIEVQLALEGDARISISTGLPFLDHMLDQTARFAGFDLRLAAAGDLHIDEHHTTEDCGIALGQALSRALGDRAGIARFGYAYAPLDEAVARVVLDLSNRPYCRVELGRLTGSIGRFPAELIPEFLRALSQHGGMTLHVDLIRGTNRHHIVEAAFKALGLALRQAVAPQSGGVPSSKGVL